MSQEPSTRHFSPAELAEFLDELGATRSSPELAHDAGRIREGAGGDASAALPATASLAPVDPRLRGVAAAPRAPALLEPATMLGGGHVIPIGAPKWRARGAAAAAAAATAARKAAQLGDTRAPVAQRTKASPSHERLREGASVMANDSLELEVPGLKGTRPWRIAFVVAALLSAGLLAALSLRPGPSTRTQITRVHRPPPLPVASASPASASAPAVSTAAPAAQPVVAALEHRTDALPVQPGARREAVSLLLAGRTRAALDAYRALHASAPTPAFEQVVRLLERELRHCLPTAGTPCGS